MAQLAGYAGDFQSGGAAHDAGISEWSMDYTAEALDVSEFPTRAKAFLAGATTWTVTAAGGRNGASLLVGTTYASAKWYVDGVYFWTGSCICVGLHENAATDGKVGISYDFQGTAGLTVPAY